MGGPGPAHPEPFVGLPGEEEARPAEEGIALFQARSGAGAAEHQGNPKAQKEREAMQKSMKLLVR